MNIICCFLWLLQPFYCLLNLVGLFLLQMLHFVPFRLFFFQQSQFEQYLEAALMFQFAGGAMFYLFLERFSLSSLF